MKGGGEERRKRKTYSLWLINSGSCPQRAILFIYFLLLFLREGHNHSSDIGQNTEQKNKKFDGVAYHL